MEHLDIVNDNDEVVGTASHKEIYEKFLPHRIVHVLLFNDKGEMALQLRSRNKYFFPHFWSTSVGGHVQASETYEHAALREFREELGTSTDIAFLGKNRFEYKNFAVKTADSKPFIIGPEGFVKMISTFKASFNGPFRLNPDEVEKVEFFSRDKIREMIQKGENLHPELLFLLKNYFNVSD